MNVTWTKEPPTEPGWYWIEETTLWGVTKSFVKEVTSQIERDQSVTLHIEDIAIASLASTTSRFRFAGPIPEPQEAE